MREKKKERKKKERETKKIWRKNSKRNKKNFIKIGIHMKYQKMKLI